MRCTKCGSEMRVGSEEYCKDVQGRPMYKNFAYCDTCKLKYDIAVPDVPKNINYKQTKKTHKGRGCIISLLIVFLIILGAGASIKMAIDIEDARPSKNPEETNSAAYKFLKISGKKGKKIDSIFQKCGITEITEIKHDKMLDEGHSTGETGYRIAANGVKNIILCLDKDKNVTYVIYASHKLYKDGKYKASLTDYTMTLKEQDDWRISCEEYVKNILKSPSTADFASRNDWKFSKNKKKLIIQSYVDSQNGFGATIRSYFQITINRKTGNTTSFIFDGKEMLK